MLTRDSHTRDWRIWLGQRQNVISGPFSTNHSSSLETQGARLEDYSLRQVSRSTVIRCKVVFEVFESDRCLEVSRNCPQPSRHATVPPLRSSPPCQYLILSSNICAASLQTIPLEHGLRYLRKASWVEAALPLRDVRQIHPVPSSHRASRGLDRQIESWTACGSNS